MHAWAGNDVCTRAAMRKTWQGEPTEMGCSLHLHTPQREHCPLGGHVSGSGVRDSALPASPQAHMSIVTLSATDDLWVRSTVEHTHSKTFYHDRSACSPSKMGIRSADCESARSRMSIGMRSRDRHVSLRWPDVTSKCLSCFCWNSKGVIRCVS